MSYGNKIKIFQNSDQTNWLLLAPILALYHFQLDATNGNEK